MFIKLSVADVRKQSNLTSSLYSNCELTLMLCACACDSSGKDLCTFAYALAKTSCVFVIDVIDLISAENADLLTSVIHLILTVGS